MHRDKLICLLNLEMSITKLTSFIWNSKRLYATKMCVTINPILKTPTELQIIRLLSIFVHIQSFYLLLF